MKRNLFKNLTNLLAFLLILPAAAVAAEDPPGAAEEQGFDYLIEKVEIRGNVKTADDVVKRHLLLREGELVDEVKLLQSRVRLMNLGYFNDVSMRLEKGSIRGRVVLVVELVERGTLVADELALGLSRSTYLFAGLGLMDMNFLGRGVNLSGAFVYSNGKGPHGARDQQGYRLRYYDPELLGTNYVLSLSSLFNNGAEFGLTSREQVPEDEDPRVLERLEYRRAGGNVTGGYRSGNFSYFFLGYRLEGVETRFHLCKGTECPETVLPGTGGSKDDDVMDGRSYLSTLNFSYEWDTRVGRFVPTAGTRISVAIELGTELLGGDYPFSKYVLGAEKYIGAFSDHVLKLRMMGGLIQGRTPFFNKFFRADYSYFIWDKDSLPRVLEINVSELSKVIRYDPVAFSMGAEYDIPLWIGEEKIYRGIFYTALDFTITSTVDRLTESSREAPQNDPFPLSFDVGLKFDTAVGLFTFSVSYVLDVLL